MSLVFDSSVTLAWVYEEETTDAVLSVFKSIKQDGAWVPSLWHLEVGNVLEMSIRRGVRDVAFGDVTLSDLASLPIRVDPETDHHAWGATKRLAAQHALTLYDAAYLELARRRGLPLATLDKALRKSAETEGVPLLGI
ncbi:MAG: VapC toxin family PIN domain ribonuclease [Phenylobacterium zucineum]|nr:MAG: VapC toxin family PIN domain ribonuclease [Phenylobacterium zucineum]